MRGFYENCRNNKPGMKGYPRFKHNTRSVEYKVSGWKLSDSRRRITFTDQKNIGTLKLIGSRDIYFYRTNQKSTYCQKGRWYNSPLSSIIAKTIPPSQKAIGIDVGLKYFYADTWWIVNNPRFYRKSEGLN